MIIPVSILEWSFCSIFKCNFPLVFCEFVSILFNIYCCGVGFGICWVGNRWLLWNCILMCWVIINWCWRYFLWLIILIVSFNFGVTICNCEHDIGQIITISIKVMSKKLCEQIPNICTFCRNLCYCIPQICKWP